MSIEAEPDAAPKQYVGYPCPERDPAKELERLTICSPSHPLEVDHFIFGGQRDWTEPTRILVAGGGTGDALVMMAQVFADWGANVDLHYLDLSEACRKIAEARMAVRGLTATYHKGDVLTASQLGSFDYIDCSGVLNRLADPDAGAAALAKALAPGGGLGAMVHAPYGRAGVYELREALRSLGGDDTPSQQVSLAQRLLSGLPHTSCLARNPFAQEYLAGGEAGVFDLLFQAHDRAYDVDGVYDLLDGAGLEMVSFVMPGQYNPQILIADEELRQRAAKLSPREAAGLAERLAGNIKAHVFYAVPKGTGEGRVASVHGAAVPNIIGAKAAALAQSIWDKGRIAFNIDGLPIQRKLPQDLAGLVTAMDGKRDLNEIAQMLGWDSKSFGAKFQTLYQPLNNYNLLRFSARRGL